ncbi:spindle pole body-associated protein [Wolffia australiana]
MASSFCLSQPSVLQSLPPKLTHNFRHLGRRFLPKVCNFSSCAFISSSIRVRARKGAEQSGDEAMFLDDEGVVEDMDGYLNYLSLEYDSIWDTKPSWCQPWTILLTGVLGIACSWIFVHSSIITAAVSALIFAWWFIFLYSYPKAYTDMIAQRREKVVNGVEDTFGSRKNQ